MKKIVIAHFDPEYKDEVTAVDQKELDEIEEGEQWTFDNRVLFERWYTVKDAKELWKKLQKAIAEAEKKK